MVEIQQDCTNRLIHADIEYNRRNINKALISYYRVLKSQNSKDTLSSIYYTMGSCFYLKHDYKKAITKFKKAIALCPGHVRSYNAWGSSLSNLGEYEEAIEKFKKVIDLDGTYAIAHLNWVLALLLQGKQEEAGKFFEDIQLNKFGFVWYERIYKEEVKILEGSILKRKTNEEKEAVMKRIESTNRLLELILKKSQRAEI